MVPLDVDNDGDLDLWIVNAQGWEKPGDFGAPSADPMRPTLLIQTGLVSGVPVFVDQTDALIPASIVVHGKATAVCDVDGDGLEDLVIAVAFGDQQRLLRKDPVGPGYLDETFRLPTLIINSNHVGWGDLDDDGDIDLVFADAGPNSFNDPGGRARLLINDGAGFFTEAASQFPSLLKVGAQNAKIIDIDNDLDLDVVIDGKSSITQVYLNDGQATFTHTPGIIPEAGAFIQNGAYETEWGDLDGDLDLDCMFMNFKIDGASGAPLADIAMRNLLAETGQTKMNAIPQAISGDNAQDENDFVLFDTDNDGDLDVLVAALNFGQPATSDKLFINSGSMGENFLVQAPGAITTNLDPTLDMAVADFNNDGRYDLVTANGEVVGSPFDNRYFENTGPIDTTSPTIGRLTALPKTITIERLNAGFPIRTWVQDSVVDDGVTFVTAELEWELVKRGFTTSGTSEMLYIGGNLHRALLQPIPTNLGIVGGVVSINIAAQDPQANASTSTVESSTICGAEPFGPSTGLSLRSPRSAGPGSQLVFNITGGDANQTGVLNLGTRRDNSAFAGGTLLVNPSNALNFPFQLDANGRARVTAPVNVSADAGDALYAQAIADSLTQGSGTALSNGTHIVLCEFGTIEPGPTQGL